MDGCGAAGRLVDRKIRIRCLDNRSALDWILAPRRIRGAVLVRGGPTLLGAEASGPPWIPAKAARTPGPTITSDCVTLVPQDGGLAHKPRPIVLAAAGSVLVNQVLNAADPLIGRRMAGEEPC